MRVQRALRVRGKWPHEWHGLSRDDQLDVLAYEQRRGEFRAALLNDIIPKMQTNDSLILAQVLILLLGD